MKDIALALALLVAAPAFADEPARSPAPAPDPGTKITLTLGELQQIIAAQVAEAQARAIQQQAAPALQKVQEQLRPPGR